MSLILFNDHNFDQEVLKSKKVVLVDFWAEWCGPCQTMIPIVEELAKEYKDQPIKIGKLNVDENRKEVSKYGIMSIPTFILFKDGKVINQLSGVQPKEKLKKILDQNL